MTFRTNFSAAVTAVLAILLLLFGGAAPVAAQFDEPEIPDQVVFPELALEPSDPRLGEQVRAVVRMKLHPGWHIYSVVPATGDFAPISTTLTLDTVNLEAQGPIYESNPRPGASRREWSCCRGLRLSGSHAIGRLVRSTRCHGAGGCGAVVVSLRYGGPRPHRRTQPQSSA